MKDLQITDKELKDLTSLLDELESKNQIYSELWKTDLDLLVIDIEEKKRPKAKKELEKIKISLEKYTPTKKEQEFVNSYL